MKVQSVADDFMDETMTDLLPPSSRSKQSQGSSHTRKNTYILSSRTQASVNPGAVQWEGPSYNRQVSSAENKE
jgi:hypothetical protein